jgi:hypothetical protein
MDRKQFWSRAKAHELGVAQNWRVLAEYFSQHTDTQRTAALSLSGQ